MTEPGDVLAGRYRLVHRVATGGMGSVWEAWDELLQRRVAIKELIPQPGVSQDDAAIARSRVIREARITARLHHPHAVTLYDVIDHHGQPCLVLQYVPSRTLSSLLADRGLQQVQFVTTVGGEVASALAAAHRVGIIHRDVKPSNVLITPAGAAMITDFGISHAAGDVSLTSTGMVTGTPAYLAPEVARGDQSGFPADVFSLGATLYAALEGTPPFGTDQNAMAILHKVASGQIIPPRRSGPLTTLLGEMLATEPAARPTMSTVAQLLADGVGQPSAPAHGPQPPTIAVPPRTIREWPPEGRSEDGAASPVPPGVQPTPTPANAMVERRRTRTVVLTAAAALVLAGIVLGVWLLVGRSHTAHPTVAASATTGAHSTPGSTHASPRASAPSVKVTSSTPIATSSPAPHPTAAAPPANRTPETTAPARPRTSPPAATVSDTPRTTAPARSGGAQVPTTSAELASAVTAYYALLPVNTDDGWAHLTGKFQTGTARNRQYYQSFWDNIQRVTATGAHGVGPDTAEATITYFFKDGRTAVERTVYSLVRQDGILKIDSSTVLSSTSQ